MIIYLLVTACIVLTGIGQLLLKIGANNKNNSWSMFINPFTVTGYLLILSVTVFTVLALKVIDLKLLYALMALNYIILLALSKLVLNEPLTKNKIIATLLIFLGVAIFNL